MTIRSHIVTILTIIALTFSSIDIIIVILPCCFAGSLSKVHGGGERSWQLCSGWVVAPFFSSSYIYIYVYIADVGRLVGCAILLARRPDSSSWGASYQFSDDGMASYDRHLHQHPSSASWSNKKNKQTNLDPRLGGDSTRSLTNQLTCWIRFVNGAAAPPSMVHVYSRAPPGVLPNEWVCRSFWA